MKSSCATNTGLQGDDFEAVNGHRKVAGLCVGIVVNERGNERVRSLGRRGGLRSDMDCGIVDSLAGRSALGGGAALKHLHSEVGLARKGGPTLFGIGVGSGHGSGMPVGVESNRSRLRGGAAAAPGNGCAVVSSERRIVVGPSGDLAGELGTFRRVSVLGDHGERCGVPLASGTRWSLTNGVHGGDGRLARADTSSISKDQPA